MGRDTYYDILGVSRAASADEIKAGYRSVIRKVHPDVDGPAALFRQVQEAYEVLSDPVRRASYDRWLDPGLHSGHSGTESGKNSSQNAQFDLSRRAHSTSGHRRKSGLGRDATYVFNRHPAGSLAMVGAILLVFGAALTEIGLALILLGVAALLIAGVAGLGGRGAKQREAYQRLGMTAVDAMTGRQFEVLLENFFANKGYRVALIGGRRGEAGRDLLLNDTHGRVIVQARRWNRVVSRDAVQEAIVAMAHYGADRALVVTSSDYSPDAVSIADSHGVILWNRAMLAVELTAFRDEPFQPGVKRLSTELQAGSRICLGFFAALSVTLIAVSARARSLAPAKRHRQ